MNWSVKSVVFTAINVFFVTWLVITLATLLQVIGGEDPLALVGVMIAGFAFLAAGIALLLLHRSFTVPLAGRALPFIAFISFIAIAVSNVSYVTLWLGVVLSAALLIGSIITAVMTLRRT